MPNQDLQKLSPPPMAYQILQSIRRIARSVSVHSKQLARETGLTVPQLLCLKAIGDTAQGFATAADVSRHVQLSPATVTGIIDRLERSELVVRRRCSEDRRKVCLTVTERGREQLGLLPAPLRERFLTRLAALDDPSREKIFEALELVVCMMEAADLDEAPFVAPGDLGHESPESTCCGRPLD